MVKPGKKKVVEELSRKKLESRKNGTAPESDNEEKDIAGSNGDTGSSVSHSTAASTSSKPQSGQAQGQPRSCRQKWKSRALLMLLLLKQ